MNFDKESKSEEKILFFFFVFGGGGGGGGGGSNWKKNRYSLIFCAHALYKISSSWLKWFSSFKGRCLEFGRHRNFANLLSKLSESTIYKEISKFQ